MAQTYWSGPLASGDRPPGSVNGSNVGLVVLSQTVLINFDATLVQNATINLPVNTQLFDVYVDVLTAFNSATSATLSVGTSSGGTQYVSGINAKTAGRSTTAHTAAQLAAMANVGTNTAVTATVTSVGQPTAGQLRVTYLYIQTQGI